MTDTPPRDFNKLAADWDEKPQRRQIAAAVAAGIAAAIPLHRDMHALEFGCGTGLVGLQLAGQLGQLVAVDTAGAMLMELQKKCRDAGIDNVTPLLHEAGGPLPGDGRFDLLFTCMVLHHVTDTDGLLRQFHGALKPGGYLALADLEREDGTFHDHPGGVAHHGFDRRELVAGLQRLGFVGLRDQTVHTVRKEHEQGPHAYPIFLVTAQKPR